MTTGAVLTVPGTRWIARRGQHTGVEVDIVKVTGADRVVFRHKGGKGGGWNKSKSEASGPVTLARDLFLATYEPRDEPAIEAPPVAAQEEPPFMAKRHETEPNGTAPVAELESAEIIEEAPPAQRRRRRAPNRVLTAADIAEVIRLYQDPAMPLQEIQQAYGIAGGRLYSILREHGIPTRQIHAGSRNVAAPAARQWTISFNVMVTQTTSVAAASLDEALYSLRAEHGQDVDIVQVQRQP